MTTRADRMAALERLAAPGSGATDPERDTARRILERMREEKSDVPKFDPNLFDMNLWARFVEMMSRADAPFSGAHHPQCRCTAVSVEDVDPFAATSPAEEENMDWLAELLGYTPRRRR